MTTAAFSALSGPTARAVAAVRELHCPEPTFKPTGPVSGHIACPRCGSRVNFTVAADGYTSGRCVAAACIRWSRQ